MAELVVVQEVNHDLSRGGSRYPERGGGLRKCSLVSTRGWVREGDVPPPARSAQDFGFAHL